MKNVAAVVLLVLTLPALAAPFALRPEVPLSEPEYGVVPGSRGDAHIATDGDGYLAVWTDYRAGGEPSVWAARLRADGSLIDRTGLRVVGYAHAGGVVWTGSHYLLVYDVEPAGRTYVRTMSRDAVFGEPIEVGKHSRFGAMATNGTNVLLILYDEVALLDLQGHKLKTVPLTSANGFYHARVVAAGSTYLVALALPDVTIQTVSTDGVAGPVRTLADREVYGRVGLATDGDRVLVVWPQQQLRAQLVARDGTPIGTPQTLTTALAATEWPSAAWRDGEFFVTFSDVQQHAHYGLRVHADATPAGEPHRIGHGLAPDVEITTRGRGGIALLRGVRAGVFDDGSVAANAPFREIVDVPIAARTQTNVRLARLGNGYVAAWEEDDRIFVSTAAGMTPVGIVGNRGLIDVLVDRSNIIWVIGGEESSVRISRFLPTLQPVDPLPVSFYVRGHILGAAAAGDGAIALAYSSHGADPQADDWDITALVLRETGQGIARQDVPLTTAQFDDRNAAVAFDGTAFVYGWIHQKGPYPTPHTNEPLPETEILAARVSTDGELLDATPRQVALTPDYALTLEAARGANGVAFAWQMYESSMQAALPGGPIRDLGGASMALGALASHDGGFLLVRGHARRTPDLTEVEYLVLNADLSLTATGALPPYAADAYWKGFDIDAIGGGEPVFAYAKSASEGRYGHVSRVFVRRTGENPPRRRAVR